MLNFEEASRYLTVDAPESLKLLISNAVELENEKKECIKKELLQELAKKEPHFYTTFEAETNVKLDADDDPDYLDYPDSDGDYIFEWAGWELMRNGYEDVIVYIHETAKPEDVLRVLEKIRERIKRTPYLFTNLSRMNRNHLLDSASRNEQ